MSGYLDTAVLVAALTNEAATASVQAWLGSAGALATSRWTVTEFSGALALKVRTGQLSEPQRRATLDMLPTVLATSRMVALTDVDFHRASGYVDTPGVNIRPGDALHLAVAHRHALPLWTLDRRFQAAGIGLGEDVRMIELQ